MKMQQTAIISEIYYYFLYRFRYWINVFVYWQVLYENASERVYEDDTEYKFNEKVWRSELNAIKQSINRILHAHAIAFFNSPWRYLSTSFFVESCRENFYFWKEAFPELWSEIRQSFLEVAVSFYVGHDIEKFRQYFNIEETEEDKTIASETSEEALEMEELRVSLKKKDAVEKTDL